MCPGRAAGRKSRRPRLHRADTGAGTCAMTKSTFARWVADRRESLFRLTTRDGTVVEPAEMYLP